MAGRCVNRLGTSRVELHPLVNPPGKKRADCAVTLDGKRVFIEITWLGESQKAAAAFGSGLPDIEHPGEDMDRIVEKLLGKVAPELNVNKSQLSATDPNVIIVYMTGAGSYKEAREEAFAAIHKHPERLRQVIEKRNCRLKKPYPESELEKVVDAFSRISGILVFRRFNDGDYLEPWLNKKALSPLDATQLEEMRQFFMPKEVSHNSLKGK